LFADRGLSGISEAREVSGGVDGSKRCIDYRIDCGLIDWIARHRLQF
jgi:hypothetical protein